MRAVRLPISSINRAHPQLDGCRFFWHAAGPGGIVAPHNLVGPGVAAVQPVGSVARTNQHGGNLVWTGHRWAWPNMNALNRRETNAVTVIASLMSPGTAFTTQHIMQAVASGASAGFQMFHLDGAFSNRGINFMLFNSTTPYTTWIDIAAATYNRRCVYAAAYKKGLTKAKMFMDGREAATSSSGDPSGLTIPLWGAAEFDQGGPSDDSTNFTGEFNWFMMFDRYLSPAQIAALSNEATWEFLDDDPALSFPTHVSASYTSFLVAAQGYSPSGPVVYETGLDALAYVDGDLAFGPQPAAVATYRNALTARQTYAGSAPTLIRHTTRLQANQALAVGAPVLFSTVSRVGQRTRGKTDGRVDLLGNLRYRR